MPVDLLTAEEEKPAPPGAGLALPDRVRFALEAAGAGLPVLPVRPGSKKPRIENWPDRATCDPAKILLWAAEFPGCNFGAVLDRRLAIDQDNSEAEDEWEALQVEHRADLEAGACIVKTGGEHNGRHIYFDLPADMEPREVEALRRALAARGIEAKTGRQYVVLPGSTVRREYKQIAGSFKRLPPLPEALRVLARQRLAQEAQAVSGVTGVPKKRAGIDRRAWQGVQEGRRNTTAAQVAGKLLGAGLYAEADAWRLLLEWNLRQCRPALHETELRRVFDSIAEAERRGGRKLTGARVPLELLEAQGLGDRARWCGVLMCFWWQRGEAQEPTDGALAELAGDKSSTIKRGLAELRKHKRLWRGLQKPPSGRFVIAPVGLLSSRAVSWQEKLTGLAVAFYAGPDGSTAPVGEEKIAARRGITRQQVSLHLRALAGAGLLSKRGSAYKRKQGKREHCNCYTILHATSGAVAPFSGIGSAKTRRISSTTGGSTDKPSLEATGQAVDLQNPYMGSSFKNLDRTLEAVGFRGNSECLARADKLLELKPLLAGEARQVLLEAVELDLRGDYVSFAQAVELLLALVEVYFPEVLTLVEEACGAAA